MDWRQVCWAWVEEKTEDVYEQRALAVPHPRPALCCAVLSVPVSVSTAPLRPSCLLAHSGLLSACCDCVTLDGSHPPKLSQSVSVPIRASSTALLPILIYLLSFRRPARPLLPPAPRHGPRHLRPSPTAFARCWHRCYSTPRPSWCSHSSQSPCPSARRVC